MAQAYDTLPEDVKRRIERRTATHDFRKFWEMMRSRNCCSSYSSTSCSRASNAHRWSEGDVLVWDNLWTLHNAEADYRPDEPRLIKRCQAMADLVFTPDFAHLAQAATLATTSTCS